MQGLGKRQLSSFLGITSTALRGRARRRIAFGLAVISVGALLNASGAEHDVAAVVNDDVPLFDTAFDIDAGRVIARDERSITFASGPNEQTTRLFPGPVHFRERDGSWRPIDPTLDYDQRGGFRVSAGPAEVELADRTGTGNLASVKGSGWSIGFDLQDATPGVRASLADSRRARGKSPNRGLGATGVEFAAIRDGVTLALESTRDGLKETLILDERPPDRADARFVFDLALSGVTATTHNNGVDFVNSQGRTVVRAPAGLAWDSADPGERSESLVDVRMTDGALVVTPDWEWLQDPARRFPVHIDPTFSLDASKDTFVSDAHPTHNYSSHQFGRFGKGGGEGNNRVLMSFDLSSLPSNGTLSSATWNGYVYQLPPTTAFNVKPVQDSWGAANVNWSNQPDVRSAVINGSTTLGLNTINLTQWAQNWRSGTWPNHGIRLGTGGTTGTLNEMWMSDAAGEQPFLDVVITDLPQFSVDSPVSISEGDSGTANLSFTVRKMGPAGTSPSSVSYATVSGTATSPSDYSTRTGVLTFNPNEQSKVVSVPVVGETAAESDETFMLQLSNPVNAEIAVASATASILDDDTISTSVAIADVVITEGAAAQFTLTKTGTTAQTIAVDYATANASAIAPADYTVTAGSVSFGPSELTRTITVPTLDDTVDEPAQFFYVNLSNPHKTAIADGQGVGTVEDNDAATASVSIADVTVGEGDSGTSAAVFTITRSGITEQVVSVTYATADGTALTPGDYTQSASTVAISPSETTKTVAIAITPDNLFEETESFVVEVTEATSASIGDGQAIGTIEDDDPLPAAPTITGTSPASPANDNSPEIVGLAPLGTTVTLRATSDCTEEAHGTGTAQLFATTGLPVVVPDDSESTYWATASDVHGNTSQCSPSSMTYVEESGSGTADTDPRLGPPAGVLLWTPAERPGSGRLLDLCDDADAVLAGLDGGGLAGDRENFEISCVEPTPSAERRYAAFRPNGSLEMFTQAEFVAHGTSGLLGQIDSGLPPLLPLGSLFSGYAPPTVTSLNVVDSSLSVVNGVLRGVIYNGTGQFARATVVHVGLGSELLSSLELSPTIQSSEVWPFEVSVGGGISLDALDIEVTALLSPLPDINRSFMVQNGAPGGWTGPAAEYPGIDALASSLPAEPIHYYETVVRVERPFGPLGLNSIEIEEPRAQVVFFNDGVVLDVADVTVYDSPYGQSPPASNLGVDDLGVVGFFPPADADAFVLMAWGV